MSIIGGSCEEMIQPSRAGLAAVELVDQRDARVQGIAAGDGEALGAQACQQLPARAKAAFGSR